jgi:hypothetical protein
LIKWAAEGLRLPEINELASKHVPPFKVEWEQLKYARSKSVAEFTRLREESENEALSEGLARKAIRIRRLAQLAAKLEDDLYENDRLWVTEPKQVGPHLVEVEKFNAAEVKEYRGLLDDIAREIGDRRQGVNLALTKELDAFLDQLKDNLDADTYAQVLAIATRVEAPG